MLAVRAGEEKQARSGGELLVCFWPAGESQVGPDNPDPTPAPSPGQSRLEEEPGSVCLLLGTHFCEAAAHQGFLSADLAWCWNK